MTRLHGPLVACVLMAAGVTAHAQTAQQTPNAQRVQRVPPVAQQVRPPLTEIQPPLARALPPAQPTPHPAGAVTVAASAGWVPTGVKAQAGGQLTVLVRDGRWSVLGTTARIAATVGGAMVGADGMPNTAGPGTLLATANRGALIGRIGDGAPFLIGSRYTGVAAADGELSVSINDSPNGFRDNLGALSIAVRATAPPPPTRTPETPPEKPPARDPVPGAQAPQDTPPQDTKPTTPTEEPLPPTQDPAPPPEDAPAAETQPVPAPSVTPVAPVTPEVPIPEVPTPAIPVVPLAIGAAVLAGLVLLGSLLRPRRKSGDDDSRSGGAVPKVSARIASDGVTGQSLTIRTRRS